MRTKKSFFVFIFYFCFFGSVCSPPDFNLFFFLLFCFLCGVFIFYFLGLPGVLGKKNDGISKRIRPLAVEILPR